MSISTLKSDPFPLHHILPTSRKTRPVAANLHQPRPDPFLILLFLLALTFRNICIADIATDTMVLDIRVMGVWTIVVGCHEFVHARFADDMAAWFSHLGGAVLVVSVAYFFGISKNKIKNKILK
jgi:hypothetical protein